VIVSPFFIVEAALIARFLAAFEGDKAVRKFKVAVVEPDVAVIVFVTPAFVEIA